MICASRRGPTRRRCRSASSRVAASRRYETCQQPIWRKLTHIVVEPHNHDLGRLVPLSLVEDATPEQIDLSCTRDEFDHLDPSQNSDYFPLDDYYGSYYGGYGRGYGYGWGDASFWPYYGYGGLGYGRGWDATRSAMTPSRTAR